MNYRSVYHRCGLLICLLPLLCLFQPARAQDSTRQEIDLHRLTVNPDSKIKSPMDVWYGDDKIRHVVGSLFSTTLLTQIAARDRGWNKNKAEIFAIGTTLSFGFVKELYDQRKPGNHFCWKDLTADAVGVLLGLVVLGIE